MTVFNLPVVSTIRKDESVRRAAELLAEHKVGCLVVVDDSGIGVGMLTDRDLALRAIQYNKDPLQTIVGDVMSSPLISIEANAQLDKVASKMRSHGMRRMPIVSGGCPIGLVSLDDLLADLSEALRDVSGVQAPRLHEPSAESADDLLSEVSSALRGAGEKMRLVNWRAQSVFLGELDDMRARLRRAMDTLSKAL
ncbi:MAG: signal-transduction protein with cAMP-binding, CBS, and nucleotidyltransferase domain [Planctomycetota bacterium]|jgi:signal-transduction protein with cAMP-binding, CBS, and nucleotidyltransferase domain